MKRAPSFAFTTTSPPSFAVPAAWTTHGFQRAYASKSVITSKTASGFASMTISSTSLNMRTSGMSGARLGGGFDGPRFGGEACGETRTVDDLGDDVERAVDEDLLMEMRLAVRRLLEPSATLTVHEPRIPARISPTEERRGGDSHDDVIRGLRDGSHHDVHVHVRARRHGPFR